MLRPLLASLVLLLASTAPNLMPLGGNIDGIADYSWTLPFVNVVKQSRFWGSAGQPWDGNCTVGADGWPSQPDFGNVFVTSSPSGPSILGTWLMSFEGNATINIPALMRGSSIQNQTYNAATDTTTAALVITPNADSCNCIMFSFAGASTRASGPGIKALQILQPGYALSQANDFSTPLLTLLARLDVLRFMDWAHTNGNLIVGWASRSLPTAYSFAPEGATVPWEVCFDLINTLQKDAWINIPAHADDDYVLQLAKLAKAHLAPGLNLYLEFSNEVVS